MSAAVRKSSTLPAANSESGTKRAATTKAPAENIPPRKRRRLTLVVTMVGRGAKAFMTALPPRS